MYIFMYDPPNAQKKNKVSPCSCVATRELTTRDQAYYTRWLPTGRLGQQRVLTGKNIAPFDHRTPP